MKSTMLGTLCVLLVAGMASAQCVSPYTETFDSGTPEPAGFISCTNVLASTLPAGWTSSTATGTAWRVRNDATPSSGTGANNGCPCSGQYATIESSGTCATNECLTSPFYDASGLAAPTVSFCYHMWGSDQGTLTLEYSDGVGGWVQVWSATGDQGDQWLEANAAVVPYAGATCATEAQFRFCYTYGGTGFLADVCIDEITFADGPVSIITGPVFEYQENSPSLSLTIDNATVSGDPTCGTVSPAIVSFQGVNCPGAPGFTATMVVDTNLPGSLWDLVFNSSPLVPASGGGFLSNNGQVLNLDLLGGLFWLSGGGTAVPNATFLTMPSIPGASQTTLTFEFVPPAGTTSFQSFIGDPGNPDGFTLSQATQVDAVLTNSITIVGDDTNTQIDLTACPLDCAGGFNFYGTNYTTNVWVSPNGRIMFGGADTDLSPTVAEGQGDNPFAAGLWTDLNPNAAGSGSLTVSSPATDLITIAWNGIEYFGAAGTPNTFSITLDCANGNLGFSYDAGGGTLGLVPNPGLAGGSDAQLVGLSPGNTATGGLAIAMPVDFSNGMAGSGAADSMIYDFNPGNVVGLSSIFTNPTPTLNILFTPNLNGNYDYSAF